MAPKILSSGSTPVVTRRAGMVPDSRLVSVSAGRSRVLGRLLPATRMEVVVARALASGGCPAAGRVFAGE